MFFRAAQISVPTLSSLVYTRKRWFMNRSCTCSATARSSEATTTPVGIFRPTSSAWEGPDSTTTGHRPWTSSSMTWLRRREESFSIPLETETRMVPGSASSLSCFAVDRTAKEGVATTTSPQPLTAAMSVVSFSSSGRGTPFSMGFSRFSRRTADSSSV